MFQQMKKALLGPLQTSMLFSFFTIFDRQIILYVLPSVFLSAAGIATASWEYEMERLHFEWLKEDSTNKEEQSIDVDDYISSFHFIHEACFAILLEVLKHPELEGGQMPDYSLLDLMAISSTPSNEIYEEQVPDLLPWPYCDYFLTEAEAWKVRTMLHFDFERNH